MDYYLEGQMVKDIYSLSLFILFVTYIFIGFNALALDKKQKLNWVFLMLCISLSIWSISFSIATAAQSFEQALLWRRIATFGWGVSYSIIVHFMWWLTFKGNLFENIIKCILIYLPAVFNVMVFGIIDSIARSQFHLVHTSYGWASIPTELWGDTYFNFYYILYTLIAFYYLFKWNRTETNLTKQKHTRLLMKYYLIAIVAGTITDRVINVVSNYAVPSMAPFFIMLPIGVIFYGITQNAGLITSRRNKVNRFGQILTDKTRSNLYLFVSMALVLGSISNVIVYMKYTENWLLSLPMSVVLAIISAVIYVLPISIESDQNQERILILTLIVSLPLVLLNYYDPLVTNILWPIPIYYFMIAIIFNKRSMKYLILAMSIFINLITWYKVGSITVEIDSFVHLFRVLFYLFGVSLALYINRIYVLRLEVNKRQSDLHKLLMLITVDIATINKDNFDEKINDFLKKIGEFTKSDRCYIGVSVKEDQSFSFTHEWKKNNSQSVLDLEKELNQLKFLFVQKQLFKYGWTFISSLNNLPSSAQAERYFMEKHDIKSAILASINNGEEIRGFIGLDHINHKKKWYLLDHGVLTVVANILAEAFQKIEADEEINYLAYYDSLTNLPNRVLLNDRIEQAIYLSHKDEKQVSVVFIDIDAFKTINDAYGHGVGDDVLVEISKRISSSVRDIDTVSRFGGDEFVVLLSHINDKIEVEKFIIAIQKNLDEPVIINDVQIHLTGSIGVAVYPNDGIDAVGLTKNADLAMYNSKKNGKNQYTFCSDLLKKNAITEMKLRNSLYRAIEKNELVLHYQPQISTKDNSITGYEALVRWVHPEIGLVTPDVFIPLAEQTGMINEIGVWVLNTACIQNKVWQDKGMRKVPIAVNVSIQQFYGGQLLDQVQSGINKSGLEAKYLEIEINENIAMKQTGDILDTLKKLKEIGVKISIDDFGTQYSSLSKLKDIPVDRLKIDKQFVRGIGVNSKDEKIIEIIIDLANQLNLDLIAEGVETENQIKFLSLKSCEHVQGQYFYKPMGREQIEDVLIKESVTNVR